MRYVLAFGKLSGSNVAVTRMFRVAAVLYSWQKREIQTETERDIPYTLSILTTIMTMV